MFKKEEHSFEDLLKIMNYMNHFKTNNVKKSINLKINQKVKQFALNKKLFQKKKKCNLNNLILRRMEPKKF